MPFFARQPMPADRLAPPMILRSTATAFALLACAAAAHSATYYLDGINGNDSWAGTAQTAAASNGPWRSLTRLAAATLLPGDAVLLACGQNWNGTLRFGGSGTAAAPVRVGAFPAGCATAPAIDGRVAVPASAWQLHQGKTYKVNLATGLGQNAVPNGNLIQGVASWRLNASPANAQVGFDASCSGSGFSCLRFSTGSSPAGSGLITPYFPVVSGVPYTATLNFLVPAGVRYSIDLRRMTAPYLLPGMVTATGIGSGNWQTVTSSIRPGASVADARLDIHVARAGAVALVREVSVTQDTGVLGTVGQVFENNLGVTVAHHPNQGFNSAAPGSYFLSTADASTSVSTADGRTGSQYLVMGSDFKLPPGAAITPGLTVTLRSRDWSIGDYKVSSLAGAKLSFSPESTYALTRAGWGYYFTGALWMLDSPGEWFHDTAANTLYIQTSTATAPGSSITFSALDLGADLKNKSYVTVQGVAFRRVQRGIDISGSTGVQLQSVQISQSASYGVYAANAVNPGISNSTISDTLSDAVHAFNATGLQAIGNDISNAGVRLRSDGTAATLPTAVWGAINTGARATIRDNRLSNIAYDGIAAGDDSTITGNAVQTFCLTLNDCGAIHPFQAARLTIQGNLLIDGRAATQGAPSIYPAHAVGIYLDVHTSASTISGNTIANADWGMQLLDSYNNTISGNLFFGNRQNQLWLQHRQNTVNAALGDVFGNTVRGNSFFPIGGNVSINQTTLKPTAAAMASYDLNNYSALMSPTIASEGTGQGFRSFTFADWRVATGPSGARGLDINGRIAAPMAGRAIGTIGNALIAPNNLVIGTAAGVNGWGRGGSPAAAALSLGNCPVGIASCIRATSAATSTSLISSPKFSTVKGAWYRISFDAAVSGTSQPLSVVVRNAATNATISPTLQAAGSTGWKRYSFVFQVIADATSTNNASGARIDFQSILPGNWLTVSNLDIAPLTAAAGDVPYKFIFNTSRTPQFPTCPVADATTCASFYSFADSAAITWPARLDPLKAMAIFAPNASLVDSDNDGIADAQDLCPGTAVGVTVDNKGCPLGS